MHRHEEPRDAASLLSSTYVFFALRSTNLLRSEVSTRILGRSQSITASAKAAIQVSSFVTLKSGIYRTSRALDWTLVMIPRQKLSSASTCSEIAQTHISMDGEVSGKLKLSFSVQINPVAPAFLASFSISAMSAGE